MMFRVLWLLLSLLFLLWGSVFFVGCAQLTSLGNVERGRLNHPAMDLRRRGTPEATTDFTLLGNDRGRGSVGCSTCAK
ncbi:MAG: hypothetical protein HQK53_20150 [Oligoflexia bacterium]|nr:hypothetical protein [Oligoflexia bacterium]